MFKKKVKTHNVNGAVYKTVTDWDAVWGVLFLVAVGLVVLNAVFG
ncbi:MAG: hypothetical protein ACPGOY_11540 [Rhodospirillaceae bacterium]